MFGSQVAALYQLADQYQVQSALTQLHNVVTVTSFKLEALTLLMPTVAALVDTAMQLRTLLAGHAAMQIGAIVKQPECVKQWGLLEVQLIMQSPYVKPYQGLLVAAAWLSGDAERLQQWPELEKRVQLARVTYEELRSLQEQQDVLALPGMAAALFKDCIRRMDSCRIRSAYNAPSFN
jgi:hypothetical protein